MTARKQPAARVLVVDDDARYAEWLRHHLDVLCPQGNISLLNLAEFERWCASFSGKDCDLLMLSARFGASPEDPQSQGLTLLRRLREQPVTPAVIAVAEAGNELTAVRALQLGAVDYLPKRLLTPERLSTAVHVALRRVERRVAQRLTSLANLSREQKLQARAAALEAAAVDTALEPSGVAALLEGTSGEVIPGYALRLKIGESEKAVVYLANSTKRGHHVALKVSKTLRDEAAGRQFLEREYRAIMAVKSPMVVEIYDYGVHGNFEYLAMEYLPHGDLKARILRGVSEPEALDYLIQIALALKVVHSAGLMHRDLKPPNVMLRENNTVALIDFGLARAVDGATSGSTQSGVLRGSPYYMSPEQVLGGHIDARSDFYSLGVICYELLTGHKPYPGTTAMEVLQQHVNAPVPTLPPDLERYQPLLAQLMAKNSTERFASADDVLAAITSLRGTSSSGEARSSAA